MFSKIRVLRFAKVLLLLAFMPASLHAVEKSVWRIGTFDRASGEFRSQNIDYSDPTQDPVYRVGKSKDAEDWQRFQPGPANGMTAGRVHPFTVVFDLAGTPSGVYKLKLGILYETPRLSYLRIDINGHAGLFYFHPKLDYGAGDWEGTFVPQTSYDEKTIEIPPSFLKSGENRMVITALDDPATVENSLGAIAPGHTGIVYDALEFSHDASARYDAARISAKALPTIFYRDSKPGLNEIVEVYAEFRSAPGQGEITVSMGGRTVRQSFASAEQFGERRVEFELPEWNGTAKAVTTVKAGGRSRSFTSQLTAAKKWTLMIVPHEHLDIGFTDYPARVAELHAQSVDGAMAATRRIPEFRWTTDGYWVAEHYLNGRSKSNQERFIDQVRRGNIYIPAQFANQHTGNTSLEALARSLYGGDSFAKQFKLAKPVTAMTVDVPSYTWSYASVLHNAGIKYFIGASNSWRAPIMLHGRWNEKSPFYWEGPDGGRVMMWYSRAYLQLHTLFGSPWRMRSVRDALPVYLQAYTRPDYIANSAMIFGSQLENTAFAREQSEIVGEWRKHYAWPRLEFSTADQAMARLDAEFGGKLPVYRGDLGPYWEDGYGSDAAFTAKHRQNQARITTAEKLATIPSLLDPGINPDRAMLANAWHNQLLYDEHTWTYVGATSQPEHQQSEDQIELKGERSSEGERQIGESIQRSWGQLTPYIAPRDTSIAVFNALNWSRSGIVSFDLSDGTEIVDAVTGKTVSYETLWVGKGISLPGFGPGYRRVRFEAANVPGLGYKLFALKPTKGAPSTADVLPTANVIENDFYRLTLDAETASVSAIFDKQLGKQIVDEGSPYRFGSYIYVTGGDDYPNNSLYRFGAALKPPSLVPQLAKGGKLVSVKATPFGTVITMEASAVNTPSLRTVITLFNSQKKIEFRYELEKQRVLNRESAYIAFPFAAAVPSFAYATQNAWVDPAKDALPGASREWHIASPWAATRAEGFTATLVPIDAPLVTFGDIVRGNWPKEFSPKNGTIFSWLMNNYWGTNFQAWQGGHYTFRYVLGTAAEFDPAAMTRTGLEAITPFEWAQMPASFEPSALPADGAALLEAENPAVVVTTWKLAEDGQGSIVRLVETAGKQQSIRLASRFLKFSEAWRCSLLEDNQVKLPLDGAGVAITLKPFEIVTIRLKADATLPARAAAE